MVLEGTLTDQLSQTIVENNSAFTNFHLEKFILSIPNILDDTKDFLSRVKRYQKLIM